MTVLLDTSIIIDALNDRRGRRKFLEDSKKDGNTHACSTVSVAELYAGMRPHEAAATAAFVESVECIEVTLYIARLAGILKFAWARKGVTIEITDAIIAATGLHFDLRLATDNIRHFPMPGLNLLDLPTT